MRGAVRAAFYPEEFLKWLNQKYNLGVKDVAVVYENSGYGVSTAGGVFTVTRAEASAEPPSPRATR